MSGFTNKSFDDTDPLIKYSPPDLWRSDRAGGNGLYDDTITDDIVQTSLTFVNPQLQNISFTFPEKAIAFHYYGYSSAFAVCIDTCDGPDGSTTRQEINTTAAFLSHNDITHLSYLVWSKRFETPELHTVILSMATHNPNVLPVATMSIDRFDLEVPDQTSSSNTTSDAPSQAPSSVPSPPSMSSSPPPTSSSTPSTLPQHQSDVTTRRQGEIIGGVIGSLGAVLCILGLWFWYYRRHRRMRDQNRREVLQPFSIGGLGPSMSQAAVGSKGHRPTNVTVTSAGGKRTVRSVMPGISREGQGSRSDEYEDHDSPPVEGVNGEGRMPPYYEQAFRESAERRSSSVSEKHQV